MSVLLETVDLKKHFKVSGGYLHAVDGVNLRVNEGQTLGIVGESGCGKSTLGRVILNLLTATSGQMIFDGQDITKYDKKQMHQLRKEMQIIFQDPYASLDPRMTVSQIIAEPMKIYRTVKNEKELYRRVQELMETVGLSAKMANTYPHELDGGRRQRIGIARALSLDPKFIVCDEPVSALDVSIQAQILNLLMDLQENRNLTYLFITHNLSVVKHISDEIAVMYLGQCIERGPANRLFENPLHPYTKALLSAILDPDPRKGLEEAAIIKGEVTSPINPRPGCRFASRCSHTGPTCQEDGLALQEIETGHFTACTLYT